LAIRSFVVSRFAELYDTPAKLCIVGSHQARYVAFAEESIQAERASFTDS
jgi:hypothetical protein